MSTPFHTRPGFGRVFLGQYNDRQVAIKAVFGEKRMGVRGEGGGGGRDDDLDEDGQDKREKMVQVCGGGRWSLSCVQGVFKGMVLVCAGDREAGTQEGMAHVLGDLEGGGGVREHRQ